MKLLFNDKLICINWGWKKVCKDKGKAADGQTARQSRSTVCKWARAGIRHYDWPWVIKQSFRHPHCRHFSADWIAFVSEQSTFWPLLPFYVWFTVSMRIIRGWQPYRIECPSSWRFSSSHLFHHLIALTLFNSTSQMNLFPIPFIPTM